MLFVLVFWISDWAWQKSTVFEVNHNEVFFLQTRPCQSRLSAFSHGLSSFWVWVQRQSTDPSTLDAGDLASMGKFMVWESWPHRSAYLISIWEISAWSIKGGAFVHAHRITTWDLSCRFWGKRHHIHIPMLWSLTWKHREWPTHWIHKFT